MKRAPWLYIVALFALVVCFLPANAISSSFFSSKCEMACCVGKPAHRASVEVVKKSDCGGACEKELGAPAVPKSTFDSIEIDGCKCSIRSAPTIPVQTAVAAPAPGLALYDLVVDIAPVPIKVGVQIELPAKIRILSGDSSPPVSRPNYVSLGRAPPVHLA